MFDDPFWVFVLPGLRLGLYAQSHIKLNVAKYSQVPTQNGITALKWRAACSMRKGFTMWSLSPRQGSLAIITIPVPRHCD
jgi:Zn-dependent membrane protease YugP